MAAHQYGFFPALACAGVLVCLEPHFGPLARLMSRPSWRVLPISHALPGRQELLVTQSFNRLPSLTSAETLLQCRS